MTRENMKNIMVNQAYNSYLKMQTTNKMNYMLVINMSGDNASDVDFACLTCNL